MAHDAALAPRLGNFLPYLLGRRLRAVVLPPSAGERATGLLMLAMMLGYGMAFGYLLNHQDMEGMDNILPKLEIALNAAWLSSALFVDFFPALRAVARPLPEHYPVSARHNVVTAFLLDFISLRRLLIVVWLLAAMAVAPRHALVPGFGLLLLLGGAVLSFNLRLLVALRRVRHPLLLGHAACLALMVWWLAHPGHPQYTALGVAMALLPWALAVAQLYWLGPLFSARYLPVPPIQTSAPRRAWLSPEWKVYLRKSWVSLLMGAVLKTLMVGATGFDYAKHGKFNPQSWFYLGFLPLVSFTYANNNLFGFLGPLVANELQRLGLTPRLLWLYLRIVGPVVLADCLLSAGLLVGLFSKAQWHLLGVLPLAGLALMTLGLWASLYKAKFVGKTFDLANMRNNVSTLMSFCSLGLGALLFYIPWWWLRILLAALVVASAAWPVYEVSRNSGSLRRRLWRSIAA